MKILLLNDDGIEAEGLKSLENELINSGHNIFTVAPLHEKSASSHSITLRDPLRVVDKGENRFAVTGNPADCAILALEVLVGKDVDLVISGVNRGQNMGEDILYSGTVGAAMEAAGFGIPSIAVSITSYVDPIFSTATKFVNTLIKQNVLSHIPQNGILNINVPNITYSKLKGIKVTTTGNRRYHDFVTEQQDHRNNTIFWIGGRKAVWTEIKNSDASAISEGYVSITPVRPIFTNERLISDFSDWLHESGLRIK